MGLKLFTAILTLTKTSTFFPQSLLIKFMPDANAGMVPTMIEIVNWGYITN